MKCMESHWENMYLCCYKTGTVKNRANLKQWIFLKNELFYIFSLHLFWEKKNVIIILDSIFFPFCTSDPFPHSA